MLLKLVARRASSSVPWTSIGRRSPVRATYSVASVSRSTGRRPARPTVMPALPATAMPAMPTRIETRLSRPRVCWVSAIDCASRTADCSSGGSSGVFGVLTWSVSAL